jgi:hypothetical protein
VVAAWAWAVLGGWVVDSAVLRALASVARAIDAADLVARRRSCGLEP